MIFGYNSEVREGDKVYHVQSEARSAHSGAPAPAGSGGCELLLKTQVFIGGRCIATRSTPWAQADAGAAQESLRLQHRSVLECIRRGQLDLGRTSTPAP